MYQITTSKITETAKIVSDKITVVGKTISDKITVVGKTISDKITVIGKTIIPVIFYHHFTTSVLSCQRQNKILRRNL